MNFFAELKRRNVYKVAVAYAVAGWALAQGIAQVFPFFDVPNWALRLIVLAIVIGFPVALVIAWAFEITPEGLKRTESADAANQQSRGKTWLYIVVVGAVASLGLFFLGRYTARSSSRVPGEEVAEKSIAVLPFENLSRDPDNAYFADGIQDEILTRLAQLTDLKVISRTSTEKYKSAPDNLREIGRQLGVANLVEGRVQRIGNTVHINVQLIRTATDEHLWAQSYDRQVNDVFGVEGEVAAAIATQLKAKLGGNEKQSFAASTHNPAAYDAYLRGLASLRSAATYAPNTSGAIAAFSEAVRLDPQFAAAWARLSGSHSYAYFRIDKTQQHRDAARVALEMAEKFGPELNETHDARGYYLYWVERDYDGARVEFEQVRALFPNDAFGPFALAAIARRQGRWKESRALFDQALAIDPRNILLLVDMIATAGAMRDWGAMERYVGRALDVSPNDSAVRVTEVAGLQAEGQIEQAQAILDQIKPEQGDDSYTFALAYNAILLHKYDRAIAWLNNQVAKPELLGTTLGLFEVALAEVQRHSGDTTTATATYQQARSRLEKILPEQPDNSLILTYLAIAEAGLANKERALDRAREAVAALPSAIDAYAGPALEESLARIEARFGQKDAAIEAIQRLLGMSYSPPNITPALLRLDPDFDFLRGDPRFQALVAKVFPAYTTESPAPSP